MKLLKESFYAIIGLLFFIITCVLFSGIFAIPHYAYDHNLGIEFYTLYPSLSLIMSVLSLKFTIQLISKSMPI